MIKNQNKFNKNAKKLSDAQLVETLRRKKICNERAQKIVEEFIERNIEEKDFLLKINFITQSHYDDIVEERSILKICGYPLCDKDLTDVPTQKYVISTITNKVYDITEKKKYCTGNCYKASIYIKEQILTSPLWLRKDNDLTEFQLFNSEGIS
ncbi:putative RNA polymerase II subunit B1 CTD phosphatase RPAP2 homolog [Condylostylus longicornis]|uniref:putative RNA polymerase II subunit B1 CTD phosphatase RPAP2 homolog n=1 Tax=Condylostylus longicornis TaxID=2530218 RepID=UPI00244DE76C|nr:putative RNA polymerase II subunit B1 CTD phosphatase RPAP2 homolog [Condylostylus longicornis]